MAYFAFDVPEEFSESELRALFSKDGPLTELVHIRNGTWYICCRRHRFEELDSGGRFSLVPVRTITDPQLAILLIEGIASRQEVNTPFSPFGEIVSFTEIGESLWEIKYSRFQSGLAALEKFSKSEMPKVTCAPREAILILSGVRDPDPEVLFNSLREFGEILSMRFVEGKRWYIHYKDLSQAKLAAKSFTEGTARVLLVPPRTESSVELTEEVYRVNEEGVLLYTFTEGEVQFTIPI